VARVLLIGVGQAGRQHLAALATTTELTVVGIVEPAPLPVALVAGVPVFTEHRRALAAVRPELVVVATPPGVSLRIAREAAATGARVLVEKPVVIDPDELEPDVLDARIAVAFQPHFAPGLAELLTEPPEITRAHVVLSCRRDAPYYRGWRARWASAGGILHQQAIHGLALVLRLLPERTPTSCTATVEHRRRLGEAEDRVQATIGFRGGRELVLDGRVDSDDQPRHEVRLTCAGGRVLSVTGRNLEAGLGEDLTAVTHTELRTTLYRALIDRGGDPHPCLFPLGELRPVLEVIAGVYRAARGRVRAAA
jgi:predicted dehydrogenase